MIIFADITENECIIMSEEICCGWRTYG